MVVKASASELPMGITKLSGSNPRLKVKIEIAYELKDTAVKAITLEIRRIGSNATMPSTVNTRFRQSQQTIAMNSRSVDAHAH